MKKIFFILSSILLISTIYATTIYDIQYTTDPSGNSPLEGQIVTVTGIVTGADWDNDNKFFMSDPGGGAWHGIYVYDYTVGPTLGDEVEVTGTVQEYYGLTELSYCDVNILSSGNTVPDPVAITTAELASEEMYEGVLVKISNATVTALPNNYNEWYVSDGSGTCQIDDGFYNYPNPHLDDIFLSITGLVDYSFNTYGLHPRFANDLVLDGGDLTPPELTSVTATTATSVLLTFSEPVESITAETLANYQIDNGLTVSSSELQSNQISVLLTTSDQVENTVYTITVNNVEDLAGNVIAANSTIQFTGFEPFTYDQIADIQNNLDDYLGQTVTVQGVVTIGDGLLYAGKTQFYIQDDSGRGIQIFDHTPFSPVYVRGDRIEVTGEVGLYTGSGGSYYDVQLTDATATLISQNNELPDPYEMTGTEEYEMNGTWAEVTGEIIDIWDSTYGFYQIVVQAAGFDLDLQFWDSTGANVEEYVIGDNIRAHGIIAFYESVPQFSCAYSEDIEYYIPNFYDYINFEPPTTIGEAVVIGFPYDDPASSVTLYWKVNTETEYNAVEMDTTTTREIEYFATIPGQKAGALVKFYISVIDTTGTELLFPDTFPVEYFEYSYPLTSFTAKLNIPPQPFNPYTGQTFPIEIVANANSKAVLKIYNTEGKLMVEPLNTIVGGNGVTECSWNGKDQDNKLVPLGLYICYLEVTETASGKKKTDKAPIVVGAPLK